MPKQSEYAILKTHEKLLTRLGKIEKNVTIMNKKLNSISQYIKDGRLTPKERKIVEKNLKKIKKGDMSGFISHEKLKKDLGL